MSFCINNWNGKHTQNRGIKSAVRWWNMFMKLGLKIKQVIHDTKYNFVECCSLTNTKWGSTARQGWKPKLASQSSPWNNMIKVFAVHEIDPLKAAIRRKNYNTSNYQKPFQNFFSPRRQLPFYSWSSWKKLRELCKRHDSNCSTSSVVKQTCYNLPWTLIHRKLQHRKQKSVKKEKIS